MTKKRSLGPLVLMIALTGGALFITGCAALFYLMFVGVESESIAMPEISLEVVDEDGQPVAGAEIVIEHRTEPHGRLEESTSFRADGDGRVSTDLDVTTERVFPLCMHGVPGHRYFACVSHPGARPVVLEVEATTEPIVVTVPLRRDQSQEIACEDLETLLLRSRTPRTDISEHADHVIRANEP